MEIESTDNVHEMMVTACALLVRHNKRDEAAELRLCYLKLTARGGPKKFRAAAVRLIRQYVEVR